MRPENNALEVFIRMMMVVVVRKRKTEDAQTDGKTRLKMNMAQGQRPVIFFNTTNQNSLENYGKLPPSY